MTAARDNQLGLGQRETGAAGRGKEGRRECLLLLMSPIAAGQGPIEEIAVLVLG